MKKFVFGKNTLVAALMVAGGLVSGSAVAAPYGYTAPGNFIQSTVYPPVGFGDVVTIVIDGDYSKLTLSSVSDSEGGAVAAMPVQRADGSLPDGTYSFVDEEGGVAKVRIEDGEITVLQ